MEYLIQDTTLTGIADAIRAKTGGTDPIAVSDMAAQIAAITGGGGSAEGIVYVTFMNGDERLCRTACMTGDSTVDPVEDGKIAVPTKEPTESTVYTYANGWALTDGGEADVTALVDVSEDRVVYAVYTESVREYTVNFYDGETLLESLQVAYGEVPSPSTPEKEGYFFDAWEPELAAVTGDADYYATWDEKPKEYISLIERTLAGDYINDRITTIGPGALRGCSQMTSASLPNVTSLAWCALYDTNLVSVDVPLVESIGNFAFMGTNLEKVDLPKATSLGIRVFDGVPLTALILRSATVCTLANTNCFLNTPIADGTGYIYVPSALVDSYKADTTWSTYANQFRAIESYPDICGG